MVLDLFEEEVAPFLGGVQILHLSGQFVGIEQEAESGVLMGIFDAGHPKRMLVLAADDGGGLLLRVDCFRHRAERGHACAGGTAAAPDPVCPESATDRTGSTAREFRLSADQPVVSDPGCAPLPEKGWHLGFCASGWLRRRLNTTSDSSEAYDFLARECRLRTW